MLRQQGGTARVRAGGHSAEAGQRHAGPRLRRHDLRRHGALGPRARPGSRAGRASGGVGELILDGVRATRASRRRTRTSASSCCWRRWRARRLRAPRTRAVRGGRARARRARRRRRGGRVRRDRRRRGPAGWATRPSTTSASPRASACARRWRPPRDRDSVASEYATGYEIVFGTGAAAAARRARRRRAHARGDRRRCTWPC